MINTKNDNVKPHVCASLADKQNMLLTLLTYIRYPLAVVFLLLFTALDATFIVGCCIVLGHDHPFVQSVFRRWGQFVLFVFNIKVNVEGLENLPAGGCLLLFNHQSHFDIPIICSILRKTSRFGAKIELFKLPFLAMAMRWTGVLPIARGQREQVLRIYQQSVPRLQSGESFLLAPEGTRQKERAIGPFKQGPFIFAIQAQVPIVPIVIEGASEIMPKNSPKIMWGKWSQQIQVRVLPALPTQGLALENLEGLLNQTRSEMVNSYLELSTRQS